MTEGSADTVLIAIRFVHFATTMLLLGASSFPLYTAARLPDARWARLALGWAAFLSALAWLDIDTVAISGDPGAWSSPPMIGKVLEHTEFGHIWRWHTGILLGLAIVCSLSGQRVRLVAGLSFLSVVTLAGVGHGAMGIGNGVWLHLVNQAVHMVSASVWVGGLAPLLWLIRRWPNDEVVRRALMRFSLAGTIAVSLILVTGSVNAWFLVGSLPALILTAYGLVLCAKIAAVAAMTALALVNRAILLPRLTAGPSIRTALLTTIAAEQWLALAAVALVSKLGTMMPAFGMSP